MDQGDGARPGGFNSAFVALVERRPLLALLAGLLIIAALVPGMGRLHADFTHKGFFWADDPKLLRLDAFERRFGNDDVVPLAVQSPSGIFDLETASLIQEMTARMWQVPEVIRVESISNFNWVHSQGDDIVIEPLLPAALTPEILAQRKRVALAPRDAAQLPHQPRRHRHRGHGADQAGAGGRAQRPPHHPGRSARSPPRASAATTSSTCRAGRP